MMAEISDIEKNGVMLLYSQYGKIIFHSQNTFYNGENKIYGKSFLVRFFDFITKLFVDFFNKLRQTQFNPLIQMKSNKFIVKALDELCCNPRNYFCDFKTQGIEINYYRNIELEILFSPQRINEKYYYSLTGTLDSTTKEWIVEFKIL